MKILKSKRLLLLFSVFLLSILTVIIFPVKSPVFSQNATSFSISISGGYFTSGSLVPIPSTEQPVLTIQSYSNKDSGAANISLYQTDEAALLTNFSHDKDNKKLNQNVDVSKLQQVMNQTLSIYPGDQKNKVNLPLEASGIWILKIDFNGKTDYFFLIRSENGVLVKEGDKEYIFWAQNFKSRRSALVGSIKLYNLQGGVKEISSTNFNSEGIAKTPLVANADLAVARFDKDEAIIPINLRYLNTTYNYHSFNENQVTKKYFLFTDRPIYKPGDTVYFKAIIRDDDDAVYKVAQGSAKVSIIRGYGEEPVIKKDFPISSDGTVFGEYQISKEAPTGYYTLSVGSTQAEGEPSQSTQFQVQNFRKPEYSLDLATDKTELIATDKSSAKISANYFFGFPVANRKVKYKILTSNYLGYEYFSENSQIPTDDYFYGFWGADQVIKGETVLNKDGKATINFDAKIPADKPKTDKYSYYEPHAGHNQVFSIQSMLDDGTGNPSFAKKNVLVYAGEFDIFRKEGNQTSKVGDQLSLPIILVPHFKGRIDNVNLNTKVHRENWVLDQNKPQDLKYPQYVKEEEDLPQLSATTDKDGNGVISFSGQKVGFYTLTVNATDKRGNLVSKDFHFYVTSDTESYNFSNYSSEIIISANKDKYLPTETAELTVSSQVADTDIFLAVERGKVRRFSILHLQGKSQKVNIPLENGDIPNVYIEGSGFLSNNLVSGSKNLSVSTDSKIVKLSITPDKQKYGPGEFVQLDIKSTDSLGNPISSDNAIWTIDKSLLELSDYKPDIISAFWSERYDSTARAHSLEGITQLGGGGGCFSADTLVYLSDKTTKRIDRVKVGDTVLTEDKEGKLTQSKVSAVHKAKVDGYLIINGNLKITPNHKIWVNGVFKEAGSIQIGDKLKDFSDKQISVMSVEWQKGLFEVYNLEVDKTHTFFANSFLVHNEKGPDREIFKDLAYWNPSVHTDSSGHAQVRFQLPDNLTTWVISGIAATNDTKVGQQKTEIIVQKDVFIRPILPNILRVGDQANLGAIVHNFTNQTQNLEISLQTDPSLKITGNQKQTISVKPSDSQQIFWSVNANTETESSSMVFSVKSNKDKKVLDSATLQLPIRPFEFLEKQSFSAQGNASFPIQISADADKNKGNIVVTLSPTLLGPVFYAMQYLINYPYGCVEQTVSRLAPALIAKNNPADFTKALKDKNVDEIIQKSLSRLDSLQHGDGGFSWWNFGNSDHFITTYVVENLVEAEKLGFVLSSNILKKLDNYLTQDKIYNNETKLEQPLAENEQVARLYALSLLHLPKDKTEISTVNFENPTPDILALAVLTNIQNGFKNAQTNGLNKLLSLKKMQGDDVYFEAGEEKNFGSVEASTALAIRAMLAGGAKDEDVIAAVRFLTRNRKNEYFGNTFATSQVMKALIEFSKNFQENNPSFSYTASMGNKQVTQGLVQDIKTEIPQIKLRLPEINSTADLQITQNGAGQLYSTVIVEQYNKNKNAKALNKGFSVNRSYENTNGKKDIQIGDIINVKITVTGQNTKNYYAAVKDELPAGLVPINTALSNEQYFYFDEPSSEPPQPPQPQSTPIPYSVTDTEVTENGMILSIYQINSGESIFTYKARAVSAGKFIAPPAQIELMYNPKVYGRSDVATLEIQGASVTGQIKDNFLNFIQDYKIFIAVLISVPIILIVRFLIYRRS